MNDLGISQREIDRIVKNDKEWRGYMIRKIEKIEKDQNEMVVTMTTLKIKIGFISGIFGAIAGFAGTYLTKKFGG